MREYVNSIGTNVLEIADFQMVDDFNDQTIGTLKESYVIANALQLMVMARKTGNTNNQEFFEEVDEILSYTKFS